MKKIIIAAIVAAAVIIAVIFIVLISGGRPVDKASKDIITTEIPEGSGTVQIADILEENTIIEKPGVFRVLSKLYGCDGKYKAGIYGLSQSMSMKQIMNIISSGDTLSHNFTVIEGQTVEKIARNLDEAGVISYDEFMHEAQYGDFSTYDFLAGNERSMYRLEGFLYPDTYSFEEGTDARTIITMMLDHFKEMVTADIVEQAKTSGHSLRDIIIAASIIEREAGIPEDMPLVSSVIYNRLDKGMALQMDSVVSYILQEDKVNLTYADIAVESDYNPYKNTGLPPGPICSPGINAIKAAISPAKTDYLYFVVSEKLDGSAAFSSDYNQFLKDKDAYYKAYQKAESEKEN